MCRDGRCMCNIGYIPGRLGTCGKKIPFLSKLSSPGLYSPKFWFCVSKAFFMYFFLAAVSGGQDGTLDAACLRDNTCIVQNSYCNQGVCKCRSEYFEKNGECGMLLSLFQIISCRNRTN